jgi:transcriptional regulator with XRE-family HTH domain
MGHIRDTKLLKKIAIVLKELREENGLTQEDVYNDTNIHIGRIETANANLNVSTLSALCAYFNIELSAFFERVEANA